MERFKQFQQPKLLLYYDFANGIINEEEILLQAELKLFAIRTITLLESGTPYVLCCFRNQFRGAKV
jgi:hypothetical protein